MALVPLGNYVFFLAQFQTFGYVLVYFAVLFLRRRCGAATGLARFEYMYNALMTPGEPLLCAVRGAAGPILNPDPAADNRHPDCHPTTGSQCRSRYWMWWLQAEPCRCVAGRARCRKRCWMRCRRSSLPSLGPSRLRARCSDSSALPSCQARGVRDFRGIFFKFFDGNGNLNLGLSSLLIFPELENYFEYSRNHHPEDRPH